MVKVKALKDCKFGHGGQRYVFKKGEEKDIDVPIERISTRSFEILGGEDKKIDKKKSKKEVKEENRGEN